jgi:hypothetical protein
MFRAIRSFGLQFSGVLRINAAHSLSPSKRDNNYAILPLAISHA